MKTFVITLKGNPYSEQKAKECIASAAKFGTDVEIFYGVDKENAVAIASANGLKWSWARENKANDVCPITNLHQFPG
jgi:hypothetical protein